MPAGIPAPGGTPIHVIPSITEGFGFEGTGNTFAPPALSTASATSSVQKSRE
jgi:hypothetical protein